MAKSSDNRPKPPAKADKARASLPWDDAGPTEEQDLKAFRRRRAEQGEPLEAYDPPKKQDATLPVRPGVRQAEDRTDLEALADLTAPSEVPDRRELDRKKGARGHPISGPQADTKPRDVFKPKPRLTRDAMPAAQPAGGSRETRDAIPAGQPPRRPTRGEMPVYADLEKAQPDETAKAKVEPRRPSRAMAPLEDRTPAAPEPKRPSRVAAPEDKTSALPQFPASEPRKPSRVSPGQEPLQKKLSRADLPVVQPEPPKRPSKPDGTSRRLSRPELPSVANASTKAIEVKAEPGAWSRKYSQPEIPAVPKGTALEAPRPKGGGMGAHFTGTLTRFRQMDARSRRAISVLLVIGAIAVGLALVVLVNSHFRERPDESELQLIYPYGFPGARGGHGESAPGAAQVSYKLIEEVPCASHSTCLRYRYWRDSFEGSMLVGKLRDGGWVRVNEEGLPFRPQLDGKR